MAVSKRFVNEEEEVIYIPSKYLEYNDLYEGSRTTRVWYKILKGYRLSRGERRYLKRWYSLYERVTFSEYPNHQDSYTLIESVHEAFRKIGCDEEFDRLLIIDILEDLLIDDEIRTVIKTGYYWYPGLKMWRA